MKAQLNNTPLTVLGYIFTTFGILIMISIPLNFAMGEYEGIESIAIGGSILFAMLFQFLGHGLRKL